jgi:predicted AlkP superfamily pyrophosphatase or phosphodiesterase
MKRLPVVFLALTFLSAQPAPPKTPKLVLAVVIDQFRYDYLLRFRADYNAGFARILEHGAVFTDAHHQHLPTVTAVGHAAFLSGAPPSISGIVANEWFDRETGKQITSVSDSEVQLLGGTPGKTGASPRRLAVSTIGDELKMAGKAVKVIGISIKDRSAILPAGHMADAAYWFDDATGNWVSSTYYFKDLPQWVKDLNKSRPADKYLGAHARRPGASFYKSLEALPAGNELIEAMAERAIDAEQLGKHPGIDVLAVSFSANDYVGHAKGPDSPEVREISIATDRLLGKLLDYVDSQIGAGNMLFVMTADHGVTPIPEVNLARKMPGGRIWEKDILGAVQKRARREVWGRRLDRGTRRSSTLPEPRFDRSEEARPGRRGTRRRGSLAQDAPHLPRVHAIADRFQPFSGGPHQPLYAQ